MRWCFTLVGAVVITLAGCGGDNKKEPRTGEEMYARVKELIKPHAGRRESDAKEAMFWLRRAAEEGVMQAQTDLGGIYMEGGKDGTKPDGREALRWFRAAAAQGSHEAYYYIGLIYARGQDVPPDAAKAREAWRRAADAGVAEAQLSLGLALVRQNATLREGVDYLSRAVENGSSVTAVRAAGALGNIYATGRADLPKDMCAAAHWYALAARGGDARAQLVYGIMLLQGQYVTPDVPKGLRFVRLSAGQDNSQAITLLIRILRSGEFGEKNEQEANAWARRLQELRNGTAPAAGALPHPKS